MEIGRNLNEDIIYARQKEKFLRKETSQEKTGGEITEFRSQSVSDPEKFAEMVAVKI